MATISFTLSIPQDKLNLIKLEADRLGLSVSGFLRMRALENLEVKK